MSGPSRHKNTSDYNSSSYTDEMYTDSLATSTQNREYWKVTEWESLRKSLERKAIYYNSN